MKDYIFWFKDIGKDDIPKVGGKGANLGEMVQMGVPVPPGFVVGVDAYFEFLAQAKIKEEVKKILESTNVQNPAELQLSSEKIKSVIKKSPIPKEIATQIMRAYLKLGSRWGLKNSLVAVRSSATAEDLPDASFAGQQETFLNVKGEANVVNRTRDCWASLFTPRAIFYREEKKFDHFAVGIAVPIQKMVQSDVSGIMFTINPVTNNKKELVIEAGWGLGETIVQGEITPDHYLVSKENLRITKRKVVAQSMQMTKAKNGKVMTKVPKDLQKIQKLNSLQIIELAKIGIKIQEHYFHPQDIEWAMEKGVLYIVQTRPVTTMKIGRRNENEMENKRDIILIGDPASPGIAKGVVKIIKSAKEIGKVKKGDILVTTMTNPDFVPAMRLVNGIITDKGGRTSHAAIVSRELGIPCIVGTRNATKRLKTGQIVALDGKSGEVFDHKNIDTIKKEARKTKKSTKKIKTATKIYVNLGEPSLAKDIAKKNVDGVGLLRAEFMIAQIGIHPQKLIKEGKQEFFISKLTNDIAKFCKPFADRPVVYRATDFKTNEYRNLEGGAPFEPKEENPLIGYRGAIRYISSPEVFSLELEAIKRVRNKMGLRNLWLMIPFVRTPKELLQVKRIVASAGLTRSPSFKLWMMVEIPANVIILKDFIEVGIDGISIGSNDLTMLTLGLDRDNNEIAYLFDERNKAVLWSLKRAIKTAAKYGITSSICGQAPSSFPDLTEKLVRWGITSISVNPDVIDSSRETVAWAEKRVLSGKK